MRQITTMKPEYLLSSLELVEQVFTDHESAEEGKIVRRLVEEIRSKEYYLPELELLMLQDGKPVGYVMFSRFHLGGKYDDRLLLLSPAAWRASPARSTTACTRRSADRKHPSPAPRTGAGAFCCPGNSAIIVHHFGARGISIRPLAVLY